MGKGGREPRWVVAFLRGLRRHGEVRRAAFEAGIDFTTAYERRKRHPDFAAEWSRVLSERASGDSRAGPEGDDAATDALAAGTGADDPAGPSGVLVVQSSAAGVRQVRAGPGRWSTLKERRFLAELAASANVRRAASATGISPAALYQRRLKDAAFARAWDQAIAVGKARLEALLVEAAERQFDPELAEEADRLPPVSTAEAIRLLSLRRDTAPAVAPAEAVPQAPVKTQEQRRAEEAAVIDRLEKAMRKFRPLGREWGRVHDLQVAPEPDHPKLAAMTKTIDCPHCQAGVRLRFPEIDMDNPRSSAR